MIYGYCRAWTAGQGRDGNSLESQRNGQVAQGAKLFYADTFTGTKSESPDCRGFWA